MSNGSLSKYLVLLLGISLLVLWYAYLVAAFKDSINRERSKMLETSKNYSSPEPLRITLLPLPVQNWLKASGALDVDTIHNVFIKQSIQMQMDPNKPKWFDATANQLITISPPAFNWSVKVKTGILNGIVGRDRFENGKGEMVIKLGSVLPIATSKSNVKVDQASLQRFLAEIVWYPSAALCSYVTWEPIDDHSARATMTFQGTTGSGVFHFDQLGNFREFRSRRFKETGPDAQPVEWIVKSDKFEVRNGVKIPVKLTATWKLEPGDWTWLKMEVTKITYNQ